MRALPIGVALLLSASALVACDQIAGIEAPIAASDDGGLEDALSHLIDGASDSTFANADATLPLDGAVDAPSATDASDGGSSDASCEAACPVGETQCTDGGVETCKAQPGTCPAWTATACGARQTCGASDAGEACNCTATVCAQNGAVCENAQTQATCSTDSNGCLYVASTTVCNSPASCSTADASAPCSLTCTDSCASGAQACISGQLAVCTFGSNGCWAYGPPAPCPSIRETCTGSAGSAKCTCNTDPICQGAANYCSSNASDIVSCAPDSQGCWSESATQQCTNGACSGSPGSASCCTNVCTLNATQCGTNGEVETCTTQSNGCTAWGPTTACPAGEVCNNTTNSCVAGCEISETFVAPGTVNSSDQCQQCVPGTSTAGWTNVATWQGQAIGTSCSVGVGACKNTGSVVCSGSTATCSATAGTPSSGWHSSAAPNASWDWNCDGTVEMQYPACPSDIGAGCQPATNNLCAVSSPLPGCGGTFASSASFYFCAESSPAVPSNCAFDDDDPDWEIIAASCAPSVQECQ